MKRLLLSIVVSLVTLAGFSQSTFPAVGMGTRRADSLSTLEVSSQNGKRGFMPPRFTKNQITALQGQLTSNSKGMTVYDIDDSCLIYWKGQTWSECDAISLAKFSVDCSSSSVKGNYYSGVPVTVNEFIDLSATVQKPGTYSFYAVAQNGVRYSLTSIVTSTGSTPVKIDIPASGTPATQGSFTYKLYDQTGAEVCPGKFVTTVTQNDADYTMDCSAVQVLGTYVEGQQVNPAINGLSIAMDVNSSGFYNLHTDTVNGLSFSGSGQVITGASRIIMAANAGCIPTWQSPDGNLTFHIYDRNEVSQGCIVIVPVVSAKSAFTTTCDAASCVFNGKLINSLAPSPACNITLTLNVSKPGPWKIITNTVQGISYSGSGTFSAAGVQTVTLNAGGVAGVAGSYPVQILDATNKNAVICTPAAQMVIAPNQGTVQCPMSTPLLDYGWNINMPTSGTITIPFSVVTTGPITLTAQSNGVSLSCNTNLSGAVGSEPTLTFSVSGTPTAGNTTTGIAFDFKDATGAIVCTRNIKVGFTLGTVNTNPGKTCVDIRAANGGASAPDGEYWINPTGGTPTTSNTYKTFCDMTNGGLTLIWSYSEKTAKQVYWNNGIPGSYGFYYDVPRNAINYSAPTGSINYEDYRLPKASIVAIATANGTNTSATAGFLKFRAVSSLSNATVINDAQALNNYMQVTPNYPYIPFNNNEGWYVTTGKVLGNAFQMTNNYGTYNGHAISGTYYVTNGGADRWYISGSWKAAGDNSIMPNLFGGFGGNTELGGIFLDCPNSAATCTGAQMVVSPNNRLIQVFYK